MRSVVWSALCLLAGCGPSDEPCFGLRHNDRDSPACDQVLQGELSCVDFYVVELHRP